MRINAETVIELADLARLSLSVEEVKSMRRDLEAILNYVEKLSEVDTSDIAPKPSKSLNVEDRGDR